MIIWDRSLKYSKNLSAEERESIAFNISTPASFKKAEKINNAINIIIPLLSFLIFRFNILALGISFVLTDFFLCFIDQMIYVEIPYKRNQNMSLERVQKRIDKLKKKKASLNSELKSIRDNSCRDCGYYYKECTECTTVRKLVGEIHFFDNFIKQENKYLKEELEKIKEKEIENNKKSSKEYTDKKQYLVDIKDKLEYYKAKKDMEFLNSILESINSLIDILNKKPIGYSLISNTLYIYLDELQNILNQLEVLEDVRKDKYLLDVEKISVALSDDIKSLVDRISKVETENLEVSIAVLLNELTGKEDKKDV